MQPIETRQTKLEKEVEELLKTIVSTLQDNNSKPVSQIGTNMNSQPKSTQAVISNNDFLRLPNYQMPPSEIKDLIKSAKYCLTFSPITAETLKQLHKDNPESKNLYKLAVKKFLYDELKMPESFVNNVTILDAWPSVQLDEAHAWTKVHAQFQHTYIISKIYSYVRNLGKDARLMIYIPKPLFARYRAMEEIAFELRQSSYKTMLKYSDTDLILYSRKNSTQRWEVHQTSDLPPIEIVNMTEPSTFVDIANISNDESSKNEISSKMFPTFPCSQAVPTNQLKSQAPVNNKRKIDMLLTEDNLPNNDDILLTENVNDRSTNS